MPPPPADGTAIPRPALLLGASGAVPFIVFSLALLVAPSEFRAWLRQALVAYAMVILAFVGALHWGFTIKTDGFTEGERWTWMSWSVVPALAAWAAAMVPFRLGLALMTMTFAVHLALDHALAARSGLPPWYLRLRRGLTAAVVVALLIALAAPH